MRSITFISSLLLITPVAFANTCAHVDDTFDHYNDKVKPHEINDIKSEYYAMVYTWSDNYCRNPRKVNNKDKQAGQVDYLQCGSDTKFGYVLHGLWPQGAKQKKRGEKYPRACEGDQPKIPRNILNQYLCMTPSVWLLQHEYEYHGTCMHDESLETPKAYFDTALKLHNTLNLPIKQLPHNQKSIQWWLDNNPQLTQSAIQYRSRSKEWLFCYDNDFQVMDCPNSSKRINPNNTVNPNCKIKGNINRKGKKYYFTNQHPNYKAVAISEDKGERCFITEQAAKEAGWIKAPN